MHFIFTTVCYGHSATAVTHLKQFYSYLRGFSASTISHSSTHCKGQPVNKSFHTRRCRSTHYILNFIFTDTKKWCFRLKLLRWMWNQSISLLSWWLTQKMGDIRSRTCQPLPVVLPVNWFISLKDIWSHHRPWRTWAKIGWRAIKLTFSVPVDKRARSLYRIHWPDFKVCAAGSGSRGFSALLPPQSSLLGKKGPTTIDI